MKRLLPFMVVITTLAVLAAARAMSMSEPTHRSIRSTAPCAAGVPLKTLGERSAPRVETKTDAQRLPEEGATVAPLGCSEHLPKEELLSAIRFVLEEQDRQERYSIDPSTAQGLAREWGLSAEVAKTVFTILADHRATLVQASERVGVAFSPEHSDPIVRRTESALLEVLTPSQLDLVRRTPLLSPPPAAPPVAEAR